MLNKNHEWESANKLAWIEVERSLAAKNLPGLYRTSFEDAYAAEGPVSYMPHIGINKNGYLNKQTNLPILAEGHKSIPRESLDECLDSLNIVRDMLAGLLTNGGFVHSFLGNVSLIELEDSLLPRAFTMAHKLHANKVTQVPEADKVLDDFNLDFSKQDILDSRIYIIPPDFYQHMKKAANTYSLQAGVMTPMIEIDGQTGLGLPFFMGLVNNQLHKGPFVANFWPVRRLSRLSEFPETTVIDQESYYDVSAEIVHATFSDIYNLKKTGLLASWFK